ncbi:MAG: threonine--tRNA ligase [Candidatus Parvarchaeota archaeon]|nr:threonine--tRNA ligase [Candidatus Jingweiarchaeum tengchongense]MCW1298316.1 threonine--tRNA ligase [Candidatus Jingweiarchaeum tengchongense]MCW1300407.1 threonine--tRNA ligase [Candidatus Jingweiarchaeum tengchongense]MCW1304748.1 threonine--tRNA ligase [Candidatus Jingweiarchaeum tengchongense]MCW1305338.1 threonine--tRNA ligase [Candidatus Jingweiarchaeum tengchongense]
MSEKEIISEALKAEERLKSYWYILTEEGKLYPIKIEGNDVTGFDFKNYENLKKFARYEMAKVRASEKEPPHIALMKKLELVNFEHGSDPGNLRYYPNGRLIKKLLERFVSQKVIEYGGMEVETPVMYDFKHPVLSKYLHRFPARQYIVESAKKKFFLRFAACFGQFLMAHEMTISYKHLPLRLYELTRYSFRLEKAGELCGLKRLRAFTMPDCHAFCKDFEQAKKEMEIRFKLAKEVMSGIGFKIPDDFELGIRIVREFYEKEKEFVISLVKMFGKPALIEMWDERPFYYVMKYEFNFVDCANKASAFVTDQFDIENAERYGISYVDEGGRKKYPIILHLSPSGAIERVIFALLEKEAKKQKEDMAPMLPLWLCPEQIRLLPVSDVYLDIARNLAHQFTKEKIRVGIDDRNLSIPKRVYDAKMKWVPYIIVIGEKERNSNELNVVVREGSKLKEEKIVKMSKEELIREIKEKCGDKPFEPLFVPMEISKRPIFVS